MIILCLDLTDNENLVNRVNQHIQRIKSTCKQVINNKHIQNIKEVTFIIKIIYRRMKSKEQKVIFILRVIRILMLLTVCRFRFTIVGCKHDLFEKLKI